MDLGGDCRGDKNVHITMYEILEELIKRVFLKIKAAVSQLITATEVQSTISRCL